MRGSPYSDLESYLFSQGVVVGVSCCFHLYFYFIEAFLKTLFDSYFAGSFIDEDLFVSADFRVGDFSFVEADGQDFCTLKRLRAFFEDVVFYCSSFSTDLKSVGEFYQIAVFQASGGSGYGHIFIYLFYIGVSGDCDSDCRGVFEIAEFFQLREHGSVREFRLRRRLCGTVAGS